MKDVEELINKIIKKSNDKEATYLYGVEYSHNTDPAFRCVIRFTKDGVPPVIVGTTSKKELKKTLQSVLKGSEVKDVNMRYHEAQIELQKQAMRFHEKMLRDYRSKEFVNEFEDEDTHTEL